MMGNPAPAAGLFPLAGDLPAGRVFTGAEVFVFATIFSSLRFCFAAIIGRTGVLTMPGILRSSGLHNKV
jgi:hypothetical protein